MLVNDCCYYYCKWRIVKFIIIRILKNSFLTLQTLYFRSKLEPSFV